MKRLLLMFWCFIAFTAYGQNGSVIDRRTSFKLPQGISQKDYLPDVIIVKFRKGSTAAQIRSASSASSLRNLNIKESDLNLNQLFKNSLKASSVEAIQRMAIKDTIGIDRIYELRFSSKQGIEKVINELLRNPNIDYAEPSYVHYVSYTPNDPLYLGFQSQLKQVKAEESWDLIRNSSNTIIAIVDTGTDMDHVDLKANIMLPGIDLVGLSGLNPKVDYDPDVTSDSTDHGVSVSGIASAVSDNGLGIASIAYNAKLMIVKACADNNASLIYKGYEGIKYAADNGAHIINCSFSGPMASSFGQDIVNYAIAKGSLIIACAGNSNSSAPEYPAAYKGVLAVSAVDLNDKKNDFSSYGGHISLSAPGLVYSTKNANKYGWVAGTSFSTPMVSSAAALVRARFPAFDMFQVAEQLKVSSDNIDQLNPGFSGQLGHGRLNVFRALTETLPSIKYQKITLNDKGDGSIPAGDTLAIFLDIKNFLSPASGLAINLQTSNPNIQIINPQYILNNIGTMEIKTLIGPFRVYVRAGTPDNETVNFSIHYASGSNYKSTEQFQVRVARDFMNITVNQVSSTISSNGRIGYANSSGDDGLGFIYKSDPLLVEASLMIGNSASRVSNNTRSGFGTSDEHFVKKLRVFNDDDTQAAFLGRSEFDDSGNPNPLNLYVKHSQTAYSTGPDDKYIISEYEIRNDGLSALSGVYAGLFTDWDIDPIGRDVTKYDPINRMAYVYGRHGGTYFAGVKLLSRTGQAVYYPLANQVSADPIFADSEFSLAEKYQTLSAGVKSAGLGENSADGYDILLVSGYGPFTIPINGIVKVAFALIGGDSLSDLQASAVAAQKKYDELIKYENTDIEDGFVLSQNFPNPGLDQTVIDFSLTRPGLTNLILYNAAGQAVRELIRDNLARGTYRINVDLSDLQSGIYLYKMQFEGKEKTLKLLVTK
ncbi:MAG: S8 family serine peptidase [Daejeonella sp.]|uniref:S8 family serine peptidase n=1 Tax=Daejeonella sp. TaxID=2805397 RepID=UPI00273630F2|nr:S8 family serine peptidase [Daejeonella sp.]MDP3468599.1 S8 family serine peptidase [Daejeonella sp.]